MVCCPPSFYNPPLPFPIRLPISPSSSSALVGTTGGSALDSRLGVGLSQVLDLALLAVLYRIAKKIVDQPRVFPFIRHPCTPIAAGFDLPTTSRISAPAGPGARRPVSCPPSGCGARRGQRRRGSGCSCKTAKAGVSLSVSPVFPLSRRFSALSSSVAPLCPPTLSAIAKTVDRLQGKQLTHVRPAAFHANVILAVWQGGDLVAVCWVSSAVSGEKRLAQPRSSASPASASRDSPLQSKQLSAISRSSRELDCLTDNCMLKSREEKISKTTPCS